TNLLSTVCRKIFLLVLKWISKSIAIILLKFLDEMLMNKKSSAGSKLKQLLKVKLKSLGASSNGMETAEVHANEDELLDEFLEDELLEENSFAADLDEVKEPLCGSSYSFSSNCSCYSCKPTAKASTTPTGEAHEAEAALAAALAALVAASHSKPSKLPHYTGCITYNVHV
uniref:Mersacidin/lichenicidin family type 2 lantibiotic n=1 Tax=Macrostomum lignano TaxID=282301 RepID=A0A1I8JL49_9PLAT